jgi:hypothetical protein
MGRDVGSDWETVHEPNATHNASQVIGTDAHY